MTISTAAVAEIVRLGAPEVAYWLAKPENVEGAMRLMNMDADQQIVEVGRIAQQLEASGFANDPDTEDYINQRRQAKREGRRRKVSKHEHRIGRYVVRTEWRGSTLLYDVFRSGMLVACGFDMLSLDEETPLEGIADRLFGKHRQRDAAA